MQNFTQKNKILHRHHKIPRHAGGKDEPENIILLTVAEHEEAHRILFEKYDRWQDKIAWQMLSGQISCAEASLKANINYHTGRPKSPEHRKKISMSKIGFKHDKITRKKMSDSHKGMKHTEEEKRKIGESQRGKKISPESIRKYVETRQSIDGTKTIIDGIIYPSQSAAAHATKDIWGVNFETARGRIRRNFRN